MADEKGRPINRLDDPRVVRARVSKAYHDFDTLDVRMFLEHPQQLDAFPAQRLEVVVAGELERGSMIEPAFQLTYLQAQELMTSLWYEGIRPKDVAQSNEGLALQRRHLDDMRRIAFSRLEIVEPGT